MCGKLRVYARQEVRAWDSCGSLRAIGPGRLRPWGLGWVNLVRPSGLFAESVAGGDAEGVGDEVDIGEDVELGFPVDGEVEGGVGKFVVEADGAGGAEIGVVVLKADIAAEAPEPGEGGGAADQLVVFVEAAEAEPGAEGDESFDGTGLVHKVFYADGVAKGGGGGAKADTHRQFIILCGQTIDAAAGDQQENTNGDGAHGE
jgi:hypothetical protein